MIGRSERARALLLSVAYLLLGVVAWWSSPSAVPSDGSVRVAGDAMVGLWLTTLLLVALALLPRLDRVTTWLIPAVVGPLALAPLMLHPGVGPALVVAGAWPAALVPLGQVLARTRTGRALSSLAAVVAAGLGVVVAIEPAGLEAELSIVRYVAVIAVVALPGIDRAGRAPIDGVESASQVTERAKVVVAVVAPGLTGLGLVTSWEIGALVLATALVATAVAIWFAVRPLAWLVTRDAARRSAVQAAMEADRRRFGGDLHDGPLQDVLLLARRLDDAGDDEGAAFARSIAADLRDLSGELRLPMLDDLGVGPSLEWLAGRVRRATSLDVRADVEVIDRVPPSVELAAFRIAQEALANAVRHGAPPILVRCRTAAASLSMTVTDSGGGPSAVAEAGAGAPVRIGLASMRERAEQIGADLGWARGAGGGMAVTLEWPGRGAWSGR